MTERPPKDYRIERDKDLLIFKTPSFRPEKGSVLHSDIYNREFTSTLPSMAIAVCVYMMLVLSIEQQMVSFIVSSLVFIIGFLLFRTYVFRGRYLEVTFDKVTGTAEIFFSGITKRRRDALLLSDIVGLDIESAKTSIENPDGVAFVEKISAQHGVSIPGFGEETTFHILKLALSDGTERTIYAGNTRENVVSLQTEMKEFLNL